MPMRLEMSKHSIRSGSASRPERLLQAVERLDALLAAALGLQALLVERELRVALGELEDPALVAALGRAHLDARAAALAEQRSAERARARAASLLDDDLRRDRHRVAVVLQQELLGHLAELRARPRCRGRRTGGRRARRRGPGRPARWRRCRRRRRRRRRACRPPRWPRAGARAASAPRAGGCARSAACSNSCAAGRLLHAPLEVALDLAVAAARGRRRRRRSTRGTPRAST